MAYFENNTTYVDEIIKIEALKDFMLKNHIQDDCLINSFEESLNNIKFTLNSLLKDINKLNSILSNFNIKLYKLVILNANLKEENKFLNQKLSVLENPFAQHTQENAPVCTLGILGELPIE